uniref:gamma-glutamylcyclotransferase n=1 Tax=Meloidogyne hapla TaxID=6305 RepID=A0A1I8BEN3_MELHA
MIGVDIDDLNQDQDFDKYFFYFSYGSNLLKERIHVSEAVFISIGVLNNFELSFFDDSKRWKGALASIEPKEGSRVFGCIWRVPYSLLDALDIQETGYHRLMSKKIQGHLNFYFQNISVQVLSYSSMHRTFNCLTYQYSNTNRVVAAPSPHYKEVIIAGAVEHKLPNEYIERLLVIPTNGFNGTIDLDLKAIKHLNGNKD